MLCTQHPYLMVPAPDGLAPPLLLLVFCLIQFPKQQISSIARTTANQVLVQYQTIPHMDVNYDDTALL